MSIYSAISKEIGWEPRSVVEPSLTKANELLEKVKNEDLNAFKEVFMLNRFLPLASSSVIVANIISEAFYLGTNNPNWK